MAATRQSACRTAQAHKLPGTIYLNKNRYWWKVQLPGEDRAAARPLKPVGAKYATNDYAVAVACAQEVYQKHLFRKEAPVASEVFTVAELVRAYMTFARAYYVDADGQVTREPTEVKYGLAPLVEVCGTLPVEEFGPLRLKAVREAMIDKGWCRRLINRRVNMIRRMVKWAVSEQIVSPMVLHGLQAVAGLKLGRTRARESEKRKPVEEGHVYGVLEYTTPVAAAMIELQLLTGMRPGELVIMRPCDIDRSGAVWHYRPERHKNSYRGSERIVSIGPRGQEMLRPFLLRPAEMFCFSPAESERQRREKLHAERKTPLSWGNRPGTNRKEEPQRAAGDRYDPASYGKAVRYAITARREAIRKNGGKPDAEQPYWTPYQLRHTAATKVRREMGYECAGATLGHTNMSATEIYAERNQGLADEAAKRLG